MQRLFISKYPLLFVNSIYLGHNESYLEVNSYIFPTSIWRHNYALLTPMWHNDVTPTSVRRHLGVIVIYSATNNPVKLYFSTTALDCSARKCICLSQGYWFLRNITSQDQNPRKEWYFRTTLSVSTYYSKNAKNTANIFLTFKIPCQNISLSEYYP